MSESIKPEVNNNVGSSSSTSGNPNVKQVTIKLRDSNGSEIEFKVKSTTKFSKIAKAYAEKKGISLNDIRFSFNGERILASSDASITEHELEEGDSIDVEMNQVGGYSC